MTKPQTSPALNPVGIASALGAKSSGWLRLGDGRWEGTVTNQHDEHFEITELADGWRAVGQHQTITKTTLETTLKAVLR